MNGYGGVNTCETCGWSDSSDRKPGQSCIRLLCSCPASKERKPVGVIYARLTFCPPDVLGGPHWKQMAAPSTTSKGKE